MVAEWYELRIEGSAGTRAGIASSTSEGVAIGNSGRLCSTASGHAMRFESEQAAMDYLGKTATPANYRFEIVLCNHAAGQNGLIHPAIRAA
jgi:hypothetical protein